MNVRKISARLTLTVFAVIFALAIVFCMPMHNRAKADEPVENGYYYGNISASAKRIYNAIGDMHGQGLLKSGNARYDLIANKVLTNAQLDSFSQNSSVMTAFGAARDAYYLDHPELFYIDFSMLSINVGKRDGKYVATLGSGRADSFYIENGFGSQAEVDAALTAFDAALTGIVNAAQSAADDEAKIRAVNEELVSSVEYSFCSSTDETGKTIYEDGAPYIRNAYGALVKGKAVCEGYATAFKCAMDKLGIECVIVQGYASTGTGLEPHAWNYVKLDGSWYGVDPTWNDSAKNSDEYLLRGKSLMSIEHIPDGVISAADHRFKYPELNPNDYGYKADGGLTVEEIYPTGDVSDKSPMHRVGKDGKNTAELEEEGLWTAYRYCYDGGDEFVWSDWLYGRAYDWAFVDGDGYTQFNIANSSVMYIQFALIDYAPDTQVHGTGPCISYDPAKLKDSNFAVQTEVVANKGFDTHIAPPYVKSATPQTAASIEATKTYNVVITYTENLKLKEEAEKADISVTTISESAKKYAEITDFKWSEDKPDKISFTFTPSGMFDHRSEIYTFIPTNLVGERSGKAPMSVDYYIKNENIVCNKVYGDGRLFINSYGQPSLVGAGDLSTTGWQYEDGGYVSENQRSQLMLVATKTSDKQNSAMIDDVADKAGVEKADILSSQTFEIQMNICKNIVTIPNGSTVQMSFGFPEGYGPDDEGVVFKVYHFKRGDNGKIDYSKTEEVECVVTKFGLVVNVSDFSPFAVVALDKDSVQAPKKSLFARVLSYGGSVKSSTGSTACLVGEGESVTFTVEPENSKYKVEKVTLNGNDVTLDGNSVSLDYAELSNVNELDVRFVAVSVAEYEQEQNISVVYPSVTVERKAEKPAAKPDDTGSTWYIYLIVALAVAAVAGGVVAAVLIMKKRKSAK